MTDACHHDPDFARGSGSEIHQPPRLLTDLTAPRQQLLSRRRKTWLDGFDSEPPSDVLRVPGLEALILHDNRRDSNDQG